MEKKQYPSLNENKKLIRRAAFKYHNWMVTKLKHPTNLHGKMALNSLHTAAKSLAEMQRWTTLFFDGTNSRIQVDPWDGTKYIGISNPDVYKTIATDMIPDLELNVIADINAAVAAIKTTVKKAVITPLSLREAIEEITIITKEWGDVSFRDDQLSVLVTGVSLKDENETVFLGNFWIHLDLTCPLGSPSVNSVNEIESEGGFYHPHISIDGELCSGDGYLLMREAICQGRLEDYFRIVEAILRTYNSNSVYEKLCGWYDPSHDGQIYCDRCTEWQDEESTYYCEECDRSYCENCDCDGGVCKDCNKWRCGECNSSCEACTETLCSNCIQTCYGCDENHCSDCLDLCISCNNYYCESCIIPCNDCNNIVCHDCITTCEFCEDNFCEECQTVCKHCGISMCVACRDEHKCLLAEVSN